MNSFTKNPVVRVAIAALLSLSLATACEDDAGEGNKVETEFGDRVQRNLNAVQPPHEYSWTQARNNMNAAHDAMALGADSWTVQTVEGYGVIFECPSIGFPLPFGTQITNPEKLVDLSGDEAVTLPQIEPYGLFPPGDVRGTLANCVLPNGEIGNFYSEPDITTFMFDVEYDPATQRYKISEDATSSVKIIKVTPEQVNIRDADVSEKGDG